MTQEQDMVAIPPEPPATMDDIIAWNALKEKIAALVGPLQAQERVLRAKIIKTYFPDPKEGTNKHPLNQGWELKMTHAVKREVNYELFQALAEQFQQAGITVPAANLRQKWELDTKQYRTLTAEQQKVFDQCLTVKPESPQMVIELPAKAKKAQEAVAALAAAQTTGVVNKPPVPGVQLGGFIPEIGSQGQPGGQR